MITILNFSHAMTAEQSGQLESLLREGIREVPVPLQLDQEAPFAPQVARILELLAEEWAYGTDGLLVIPPAMGAIAGVLLAQLHGLLGHFPAIVRLKPKAGGLVTRFEVAEIINLQALRDQARQEMRRHEKGGNF